MLGYCEQCECLVVIRATRRFEGGALDYAPTWHPVPETPCFGSGQQWLITDFGLSCAVCDESWESMETHAVPEHVARLDGAPVKRREQCPGTGRVIR